MSDTVQDKIKEIVTHNKIVVFMKGTPAAPQCGFSAQTIKCLQAVEAPITTIDVLSDPGIRAGIKDFTQWPTIPQVFINGKFIGGCDIVTEMYQEGDLKTAVDEALNRA